MWINSELYFVKVSYQRGDLATLIIDKIISKSVMTLMITFVKLNQMNNINIWSSKPLSGNNSKIFTSMGGLLPISLISVDVLKTCNIDDSLEVVLKQAQFENFDHIPVVCSQEIIIGLLDMKKAKARDASEEVREVMEHLRQSILISSNASILSFIETADENPCRLVLDGTKITGIVTISDLQKLEVRPVLFSLITYLELLMAEFIRQEFPNEEWIERLSPCRKASVNQEWEKLRQNNMAIDMLSATQFCDKRTILLKSNLFTSKLSSTSTSKNIAKDIFEKIEKLRDSVAHAGDYALTEDTAKEVSKIVRDIQKFIEILEYTK